MAILGKTRIKNKLTVAYTEESSSKDTGALIVEGGVGIEGNLNIGKNFKGGGTGEISGSFKAGSYLNLPVASTSIQGITYLKSSIESADSTNDRAATPKAVRDAITSSSNTLNSTITSVSSQLSSEINSLETDLNSLETDLNSNINNLTSKVNTNKANTDNAINSLVSSINSSLSNLTSDINDALNSLLTGFIVKTYRTGYTSTSEGKMSCTIPNYNSNMQIFAFINGFTLSDGSNNNLKEYEVSASGATATVTTVNSLKTNQDFMVIAIWVEKVSSISSFNIIADTINVPSTNQLNVASFARKIENNITETSKDIINNVFNKPEEDNKEDDIIKEDIEI